MLIFRPLYAYKGILSSSKLNNGTSSLTKNHLQIMFSTYASLVVLTLFSVCCSVADDSVISGTTLTADSSQLDVPLASPPHVEAGALGISTSPSSYVTVDFEGSGSSELINDDHDRSTTSTSEVSDYLTEDSLLLPTTITDIAEHAPPITLGNVNSSFLTAMTSDQPEVVDVAEVSTTEPVNVVQLTPSTIVVHANNVTTSSSVTVVDVPPQTISSESSESSEHSVESPASTGMTAEMSTTTTLPTTVVIAELSSLSDETSLVSNTGSSLDVSNVTQIPISASTLPPTHLSAAASDVSTNPTTEAIPITSKDADETSTSEAMTTTTATNTDGRSPAVHAHEITTNDVSNFTSSLTTNGGAEQTLTSSQPVTSTLQEPLVTTVSMPETSSTMFASITTKSPLEVSESSITTQGHEEGGNGTADNVHTPAASHPTTSHSTATPLSDSTLPPISTERKPDITTIQTIEHFDTTTANTSLPTMGDVVTTLVTTLATPFENSTVETETASSSIDYANFTEEVDATSSSSIDTTQGGPTLTETTELPIMKGVRSYDNLTEPEFFNSITVVFKKPSGTKLKNMMYFNQDVFKKVVICLINVYEYEGWPSETINETVCDYVAAKNEKQFWELDDEFAPLKPNDLVIVYPSPKNHDDTEIVSFFVKNGTSHVSGRIVARNRTLTALDRHQQLLSNQMNMHVAEIYTRIPVALLITPNGGSQSVHAAMMSHSLLLIIVLAAASICIMVIMIGLVCIKCRAQSGHWDKDAGHDKTQLQSDGAIRSEMGHGAHHLNSDEDIRKDENWRNGNRNGNGYTQGSNVSSARNGNRRQNGSSPVTNINDSTVVPISSDKDTWVDVPFAEMTTPDNQRSAAMQETLDTKL